MNTNPSDDGRLRALYAAAAAGLDVASFVVRAVWLVCMVYLLVIVGALVSGAVQAIF